MDWGKIIMDTVIASFITGIFAVVAVLVTNGYSKKKGYNKIDSKIGDLYNTTLSRQHEDIERSIIDKTSTIEKSIIEKTSNIYAKVEKINDITVRNEALYQNLGSNQKEIKTSMGNFILDWEKTISENKEVKLLNEKLANKVDKLINEVNLLKESKFEMKVENKINKDKLDSITSTNKELLESNIELKNLANKLKEENNNLYSRINELELEDDWDLER